MRRLLNPDTVECIGGPDAGRDVTLKPGQDEYDVRVGSTWHRYRLQPSDDGMVLNYVGHARRQPRTADPPRWPAVG